MGPNRPIFLTLAGLYPAGEGLARLIGETHMLTAANPSGTPLQSTGRFESGTSPASEPNRSYEHHGQDVASACTLPAQKWMALKNAYSADLLADHRDKGSLVSVRSCEHQGYLYTTLAVLHMGARGQSECHSYRLIPLDMYQGPTWRSYSQIADLYGKERSRGDCVGLLVSIKGQPMVLAQRFTFKRSRPTCSPISADDALQYLNGFAGCGWRSMFFKDAAVTWGSFEGHPVTVYTNPDGATRKVLYWMCDGLIEEYELSLADKVLETPAPTLATHQPTICQSEQLGLF